MSYESYCNLLPSSASNYDAQYAPKMQSECNFAKMPKRNVYVHDLVDHGEEDDDINDFYNLDCDVTDLQANLHKQHPNA